MNNLQLTVLLNAIDRISGPIKGANKKVLELSRSLKEHKIVCKDLVKQNNENAAAIKKYATAVNPLKNKLASLNLELQNAQQKAKKYSQQLANAQNPTEQFKQKVLNAEEVVKKLKFEQAETATKLRLARKELNRSGLTAKSLSQRQDELRKKLKLTNQQIDQQKKHLIN